MSNQEQFVGRGEKIAVQILEETFPHAEIFTQVPICNMVSRKIFELYDESYQKATIDILMMHHDKEYAIRIQDKHHTSKYVSQKDRIQ